MDALIQILLEPDDHTPDLPSGLTFQFALLTWTDRNGDGVDPWAVMRDVVPELSTLTAANRVVAEYSLQQPSDSKAWSELMKKSDEELEEVADFPDCIAFLQGEELVLNADVQFWNLNGGPMPYHDSVALVFSATSDIQSKARELILLAAKDMGAGVR